MNTTRGRTIVVRNLHDNFVILTAALDHKLVDRSIITTDLATIARLEVVFESITQHKSILADVQLNGVASISGGTELSEGLRLGIGKGNHGPLR